MYFPPLIVSHWKHKLSLTMKLANVVFLVKNSETLYKMNQISLNLVVFLFLIFFYWDEKTKLDFEVNKSCLSCKKWRITVSLNLAVLYQGRHELSLTLKF